MPKKITMDIIAQKLGVSKNTVSMALRGMPGISEGTRKLIEETAGSMGYQYRQNSARLSAARNLCLVIAKSTRDSIGFFSYIQLGIQEEAKKNNMNTIIHYYDEKDEIFEIPNSLKDGMISGIITLGRISHKTINTILTYSLPIVMVDNYFDDIVMDCILTDNQCGGFIATEHLIKCGHTRIGFLGDISASISFYDRYQGYLKALREYRLDLKEGYSVTDKMLEGLANEDMTEMINHIKGREGLPTAYVCCNDAEAIIAIKLFKSMGISVPDEISIIGFDDIETARNITPELTTMKIRKELMGRRAVSKLLERIEGQDIIAEKILLSATLVIRESVKRYTT